MPINRDEFESGRVLSNLERAIVAFLEKSRDKAFPSDEIMDGIHLQTDFSDIFRAIISGVVVLGFPSILQRLATDRKIRMNIIGGRYYYMAK
jgi:hypothetical protein